MAKKATTKVEVEMTMTDPKKHSVRFDADDKEAALSSAYVSNEAMEKLGNPKSILITIEAG
jgi:hypothetical protein